VRKEWIWIPETLHMREWGFSNMTWWKYQCTKMAMGSTECREIWACKLSTSYTLLAAAIIKYIFLLICRGHTLCISWTQI
jgi:hypothetical protein